MVYYTAKARETAKENIIKLNGKLISLKPTEKLTLQDIQEILHYMGVLLDAIRGDETEEKLRLIRDRYNKEQAGRHDAARD